MNRRLTYLGGLLLFTVGLLILSGCERPDPEQPVSTMTATPVPSTATPFIIPTTAPPQVYVVVVPPSFIEPAAAATEANTFIVAQQPTATPTAFPSPIIQESSNNLDDYFRENYYLGWARSEALTVFRNHIFAGVSGLILLDKPADEGESVGLVIGLADLLVAGRSRCGYTPVLVHATNMMDIVTPRPEIEAPVPLGVLNTPTPLGRLYPEGTTTGWAYSSEMLVIGQNAIAGPLGLNLRAEPCQAAKNLGFVPSAADLIVTGRPDGDYTPVLVKNDVLQLPFDAPGAPEIPITATPLGTVNPTNGDDSPTPDTSLSSPTPGPTSAATSIPAASDIAE
ncbi:MAG: hypothetical protein WA996_07640 [Candidatus Promineifilaceae bacterium]